MLVDAVKALQEELAELKLRVDLDALVAHESVAIELVEKRAEVAELTAKNKRIVDEWKAMNAAQLELEAAALKLAAAARQVILTDLTGYTQGLLEEAIAPIERIVGHPIKATNQE